MGDIKRGDKNKKQSVFTRETLGVVLVLFCTLCMVCLITREKVFSVPGQYINAFLLGVFGYFAYLVVCAGIVGGVLLITDKKIKIAPKTKLLVTLAIVMLAIFSHLLSMGNGGETGYDYGSYLSQSYLKGEGGISTASAGGVIAGLVAYLFYSLMTLVGACVVTGALFALCVYFLVADAIKSEKFKKPAAVGKIRSSYVPEQDNILPDGMTLSGEKEYPVHGVDFSERRPAQRLFVSNPDDFKTKSKKDLARSAEEAPIKLGFGKNGLGVVESKPYTVSHADDLQKKIEYIKTPAKLDFDGKTNPYYGNIQVSQPIKNVSSQSSQSVQPSQTLPSPSTREEKKPEAKEIPFYEHDGNRMMNDDAVSRSVRFRDKYAGSEFGSPRTAREPSETFRPLGNAGTGGETAPEQPNDSSFRASVNATDCADSAAGRGVRASEANNFDGGENRRTSSRESARSFLTEINSVDEVKKESKSEFSDGAAADDDKPPVSSIFRGRDAGRILFGEDKQEKQADVSAGVSQPTRPAAERVFGAERRINERKESAGMAARSDEMSEKTEKAEKPAPPINREYFRPPLDLLESYAVPVDAPKENHEERMEIIKQTLEDFHINALPQSYVQGPSITRYEIMMPPGISVKKVLNYDDDLRMRLASKDGVRIEAPIPGKNLVGVEVANKNKVTVGIREVIEGAAGKKSKPGSLMFAIGKDLVGNAITDNLTKGPHYLVAGATGSGKSVCLNVMIVSLIMRYSPEELRLILIDPKRVGFRNYEHIPHLMIDEIVTEPQKAVAVLQWAYNEMEKRYDEFAKCDGLISDIDAYNELIASDTVPKMPRIVIIVDELADLMETCKKDMEAKIRALAQKARAAGVHLVLATQRPSVDIITGTIKANLPSRIALKVMNFADSQTILAEGGAEKLLGNGDMLYKNSSMAEPERYQGAWISDREINNVVNYIIEHNQAYFDDDLKEFLDKSVRPREEDTDGESGMGGDGDESEGVNEFFLKVLWLAVNSGTVSISQLQRRFQIGYARAGGLVDKMERMGFVSANEGSKARRVLLSKEEFENRFGAMPDSY